MPGVHVPNHHILVCLPICLFVVLNCVYHVLQNNLQKDLTNMMVIIIFYLLMIIHNSFAYLSVLGTALK